MKISDLNPEYDKLQQEYGARELTSIYNGGCIDNPDICFVFMNPTGRNIASNPNWKGRRSPWIGTKNIWKLFYRIGLLDKKIYEEIQKRKPQEWDEKFADLVYDDVKQHKFFITNLGKCTQIDARVLPNSVYSQYLDLLFKEIEIINPKIVITLGNQVSSIILNKNISVSQCRKQSFPRNTAGKTYSVYPVYYPIGNGMMNIDKAIEDLSYIINTNFKRQIEYKIREIEKKDNKEVEDVIRSCLIEFGANHEGTAWSDQNLGRFSEIYNTEGNKYWVALDKNEKIVGGVGIGKLDGIEDVCELQKMYCLPEIRGTGVSHKLMDIALEYASKYYTRCYLETLENMIAAQKFYEKYGFERISRPLVKTEHFACDVRYIKNLK